MKIFSESENMVCPNCGYEFDDICEDFVLQGANKIIGIAQYVECDNCYENIEMVDNGDGTITVCNGGCDD